MTDHSPTSPIANGLSTERLLRQLEEIEGVNGQLAAEAEAGAPPFRVLSGIEVDINEDGTSIRPRTCSRHDIVVASVHSKLRSPGDVMTKRMLSAIDDPNMDILGHCTGRIVVGRGRPQSSSTTQLSLPRAERQRGRSRDQLPTGPRTRRARCSSWQSISAASSPSIPMHTHRVSSTGSTSAATVPPSVVSRKTA